MHLLIGHGYLGSRVARLWREAGRTVYVVTRSTVRARDLESLGYAPRVADVTDAAAVHKALAGMPPPDTVLFAVGYDRKSARDNVGPTIFDVYARGFANVLDALPDETRRVIYISTTGVYSQTGGTIVDEDSPTEPHREGGRASLAAEQALAASRFASRGVILRLAGIYGPGRIPLAEPLRRGEPLAVPAEGSVNLIHVDDAARVVPAAEQLEASAGQSPRIYNVSDGHPAVRGEYYAQLARLLGAPPPTFTDPGADSPATARASSDKRISNVRLLRDFAIQLEYPSYREGLQAIASLTNK
jgi:nucleoside-diphosphate-sugar epimerase